MPQIDTRHAERDVLTQVLIAQHNNDFDTLITVLTAKMEKEDVKEVFEAFENWKAKRG